MRKTVVFLSASKFSERDYIKFGGDYYSGQGFEVLFISLFEALYPGKMHINTSGEQFVNKQKHVILVNNIGLLKNILKKFDIHLIICFIDFASPNIKIVKLLRIFQILKTNSVFYHGGAIPITLIDTQKSIIEQLLRKTIFWAYFNSLKFLSALKIIQEIKVVLGAKANEIFLDGRFVKYKKYFAHTFDYEIAVKRKNCEIKNTENSNKYVVFLDEFAPFHPDNELIFNTDLSSYANEYYASLNKFFLLLEKNGYEVIIAAHPRARYHEPEFYWCFGNRKIVKNQTAELVENCSFCVGHLSTSFNYAIIFKKPIVQLKTRLYTEMLHFNKAFMLVFNSLHTQIIDIDELNIEFEYPVIDEKRYKEYMEMYIKSQASDNTSIYDVFLQTTK